MKRNSLRCLGHLLLVLLALPAGGGGPGSAPLSRAAFPLFLNVASARPSRP